MRVRHVVAICAVAAVPAGITGVAAAATSNVSGWTASQLNITCGLEIHAPGKPATDVLCSAKPVPAPKKGNASDGDPGFVSLAKTGKPTLLRLSQDSFVAAKFHSLAPGTTWTSIGVTCIISTANVKCTNASGHGFTITKSKYSAF